jgi:hypothetical protein
LFWFINILLKNQEKFDHYSHIDSLLSDESMNKYFMYCFILDENNFNVIILKCLIFDWSEWNLKLFNDNKEQNYFENYNID